MSEERLPLSPMLNAAKRASARLARQQQANRHVLLGDKYTWLDLVEDVDEPRLASQILDWLCCTSSLDFLHGTTYDDLQEGHLAAAVIEAQKAQAQDLPADAAEAKIWVGVLVRFLIQQAAKEESQLSSALLDHEPMLTPTKPAQEPSNLGSGSHHQEARESTEAKVARVQAEACSNAATVGFHYMNKGPSFRVKPVTLTKFPNLLHGCISLPRYSEVEKEGRAGDLLPGQEEHCSFLLASVEALYARYCGAAPSTVELGSRDEPAMKLTIDEDGTEVGRAPL